MDNTNARKRFDKYLILIIAVLILGFIIKYLWVYVNGFLGAFILFVLFLPLYKLFTKKFKMSKSFSAILIIILSFLLIVIPSFYIIKSSYNEINNVININSINVNKIKELDAKYPKLKIMDNLKASLPKITSWLKDFLVKSIGSIINISISILIMYFLLYYLLVDHTKIKEGLKKWLPFNKTDVKKLSTEFKKVTYATVITTGLVAILQGFLLSIAFIIFNIKAPVFWGLIAAIFSFLPIIGVPLIWIPFAIVYLAQHNYFVGIGLIVAGIIINYSEYFIRPPLQKKIGDIHPLTSILGVFVGIPAFGIVGIVVGPLLISYLLIIIDIYKKEYL